MRLVIRRVHAYRQSKTPIPRWRAGASSLAICGRRRSRSRVRRVRQTRRRSRRARSAPRPRRAGVRRAPMTRTRSGRCRVGSALSPSFRRRGSGRSRRPRQRCRCRRAPRRSPRDRRRAPPLSRFGGSATRSLDGADPSKKLRARRQAHHQDDPCDRAATDDDQPAHTRHRFGGNDRRAGAAENPAACHRRHARGTNAPRKGSSRPCLSGKSSGATSVRSRSQRAYPRCSRPAAMALRIRASSASGIFGL
jgi:hypothetical protein